MSSHLTIACACAAVVAGCLRPEPDTLCNRVRYAWPYFQIDPTSDIDPNRDGIQIDLTLPSDLAAGIEVTLSVTAGEEDPVAIATSVSGEDGVIVFAGIDVPKGDIVWTAEARDDCGRHRSGKRTFVWDGLGIPQCEFRLATEPERQNGEISTLSSEHDEDADTEGLQVRALIDAGRPDMEVRLFVTDSEQAHSQEFFPAVDDQGVAEQILTLPTGLQSFRAVCYWEPRELRPSSPTWQYQVE